VIIHEAGHLGYLIASVDQMLNRGLVKLFRGASKQPFVRFCHQDVLSMLIVIVPNMRCMLLGVLFPICPMSLTSVALAWGKFAVIGKNSHFLDHDALQERCKKKR
jgi:hypothetical protein